MTTTLPENQSGPPVWWDKRRRHRDDRQVYGANGPAGVTRGLRRRVCQAFAVAALLIALVDVVNVFSALHDAARRGDMLATWEPISWEATSGLAELVACPIILAALRLAQPGRARWPQVILVHATATILFSAVHVVLMMALRTAIYATRGYHYPIEAGAALYEYRKDVLAYMLLAALFHALLHRRSPPPAGPALTDTQSCAVPAMFDILDGQQVIRTNTSEIAAVRSAGNYAEFILLDARRPLMRTTLVEVAAILEPAGFERTHRSWLINTIHVRGIKPSGSGDHMIELANGLQVPLSRRYPSSLRRQRPTSDAS